MNRKSKLTIAVAAAAVAVLGATLLYAQDHTQDKYSLISPGGIAFADFRGYEDWSAVSTAHTTDVLKIIVANPTMINAYKAGVPGNGKPFPDGSKIAKMEWAPKSITDPPFSASTPDTVTGSLLKLEFIQKDSKRFPDTHGWGYADFEYDAASDTLRPGTTTDKPPQENDAKCGASCHKLAASKDFIFSIYPKR